MCSAASQQVSQGWLVKNAKVLASVEMPLTRKGRARGLLGRNSFEGVMLLTEVKSIHTMKMKFDIDVAFLDENHRVIKILRLAPHRVSPYVLKAKCVIEAEAGAFAKWGIELGDELEVRE